jgi:DNA topoisomerase-1
MADRQAPGRRLSIVELEDARCVLTYFEDPIEAARAAHLTYVHDSMPGIRRIRTDRDFDYFMPNGERVRQPERLKRIRALAIPPAWEAVWICPSPRGHIQATGRDLKKRKQYRYHLRFRRIRDETKFARMIEFGYSLPALRARVEEDLSRPGMPREKVIATCVRLLDTSFIRVGNTAYARKNRSFGLTTLRRDQIAASEGGVHLKFRGKAGKEHDIDVREPRLAAIMQGLQDLPGQTLFHYVDESGRLRSVGSADVNRYLRETTGHDLTAKDFRTWAGTVLAARELSRLGPFKTAAQARHNVAEAIRRVAARLGNTPAVCRKSYVHPAVVEGYLAGPNAEACPDDDESCELAVLAFLERRQRGAPAGSAATE